MNALKLRGRREGGLSLIAMLVIVILVGGISAAFFLLSMTEGQSADVARNRTKSYYLGEAAVEQVASMLKIAAANYNLPNNPVSVTGAAISGTLTASGLTSNWAFRHYDTGSAAWYPTWSTTTGTWSVVTPSRMTTTSDVAAAGADTSQIQLYLRGSISILMEPSSVVPGVNAKNSETFSFEVVNFQNISGTGVGNTGDKNYFTISVEGRVTHYDKAGTSGTTKGTQVKVTREMELNNQSLLPFFAFFNNDLEFLPGPKFVGNGKIHTNGDLYLGGGTSIDMNTDYIGAVGQMYRHRKNNGSYTDNGGPVTLHQPIPGTPAPGALGAGSTSWASSVESASTTGTPSTTWAADTTSAGLYPTVMNGATGAQSMATPPVGSIQPPATVGGTGGTFYEWAKNPATSAGGVSSGLIISVNSSGTATALYNGGSGQVDVTSALTSAGAISSSQIADNRQSQTSYVQTTVVDVEKLRTTGYFPSGGILYTTDARNGTPVIDGQGNLQPPPTPPTVPAGFVFKNGVNLAGSVSMVSNGPVYVQGDFNAPNGTATNPSTGALYTKQPASVIADAVNLLSNGWSGTKTPGGGVSNATATNYNFALITGNVPTIAGTQYSGGLENLPRFHENWGGVDCNYRGSLINLWQSAVATGVWGQNNVYSPPNRNWDWDSSFGTSTVKIPGFPKAVTINRTIFMMDFWGAGGSSAYRSAQ